MIAANIVRHGGGALLVAHGGTLHALLYWFAFVALLDVLSRRLSVGRALTVSRDTSARPAWAQASHLLTAGFRMSVAVMLSVAALQLDRIYLSLLASVGVLGVYSVATALAYGALQLTAPLVATIAPTLALASRDADALDRLSRRLLGAMLLTILILGTIYVVVGETLVVTWLRDPAMFAELRPTLRWLLLGTALNMLYQVGYQRWVALGQTRLILIVNALGLAVAAAVAPFMIQAFGMVGASSTWIALNLIGLACHLRWFASLFVGHRRRASPPRGNTALL